MFTVSLSNFSKFFPSFFPSLIFIASLVALVNFDRLAKPKIQSSYSQLITDQSSYTSLLFAGDTHFNWGVADLQKKHGLLAPIRDIKKLFTQADFRAINLETVITNKGYPLKDKSYIFYSSTKNIPLLQHLDINLAILGNNHSMDMGSAGLMNMISHLEKASIGSTGAGKNTQQALKPYLFTKGKKKFAIFSISYVGQSSIFSQAAKPGIARQLSLYTLQEVQKKSKVSSTIISIHWGREYFTQPNSRQINIAHQLINQGASAIIGHHPHIPQAIEIYKGGVILYSLGNFLFGSTNDLQKNNIITFLDYNKKSGRLARVRIFPITGCYQKQGHVIKRLSSNEELHTFWNEYYLSIKKHSPYTAKKLIIKNGVGVLYL